MCSLLTLALPQKMQPLAIAGVLSVMSGTQSNQPKQKTPKGEEIPFPSAATSQDLTCGCDDSTWGSDSPQGNRGFLTRQMGYRDAFAALFARGDLVRFDERVQR